jgi:hypothetical protein
MVHKTKWILGCLLVFLVAATQFTQAAILQIDPPKIFLTIQPGQTGSGKITVRNPSGEAVKVRIYAQDWKYSDAHDGTKVFFPIGTQPLSCASWISVSQSDIVIPADGQQEIYYTVKMPQDAAGGHFAVLFFESKMASPIQQGNVALGLVIRIGTIVYVDAEDKTTRTAEISNFSLVKPAKGKGLQVGLDVKNTGNSDIITKATFHLMDNKGIIFVRSTLDKVYTFPKDTARMSGTWKDPLPKGTYNAILTLDIGEAMHEQEWAADSVITKETEVEIGSSGEVLSVGELR